MGRRLRRPEQGEASFLAVVLAVVVVVVPGAPTGLALSGSSTPGLAVISAAG